jgi:hypothetical protein
VAQLQEALNPGWEVTDREKQRPAVDPFHPGQNLVDQQEGAWIERVPYFEAVATSGQGVFDTLKAVSKLVLRSLA